jgi:hypothetical protein
MHMRTIIVILYCLVQFGFSQTVDSVRSPDTLKVQSTDSAQVTDTLQLQSPDSVLSTSIQSVESSDSSQITETKRVFNVDSLQMAEMKKLHFLKGQWKGEAWMMTQSQEKQFIIQTENVEVKQNGLVLTIQGTGIDKNSLRSKPKMVHDAFAILYFDKGRQKIRMMAFTKGNRIFTEPKVGSDRSMIWGFTIPNVGEVKYTIRLNEKEQWFEIGEFSRDGVQWFQNFEMTLNKIE